MLQCAGIEGGGISSTFIMLLVGERFSWISNMTDKSRVWLVVPKIFSKYNDALEHSCTECLSMASLMKR